MGIIALSSAATGMMAQETALDVIANNLANLNTSGYKASRVNFQDLIYQERNVPGIENSRGDRRPIGLYVGLGTLFGCRVFDFSQCVCVYRDR